MEPWFFKSVLAAASVTPIFLAIPLYKHRFGIDPLVFTAWYLLGAAVGNVAVWLHTADAAALLPSLGVLAAILGIGVVGGTLANGLLAQSVTLAPNPGLPPVIYATASLIVFVLSAVLARHLPELFKPVSAEPTRLAGIGLVLVGLWLLASRPSRPDRTFRAGRAPAWFLRALLATLAVTPTYIAIPLFQDRFGVDPLIFMIWYFTGVAVGVAAYSLALGTSSGLVPPFRHAAGMIVIGALFGSLAYGALFQAVSMAPNPGLPPVIYATASLSVFALSPLLSRLLPDLFKPVSTEPKRLAGIGLVLLGLWLLAGGRLIA